MDSLNYSGLYETVFIELVGQVNFYMGIGAQVVMAILLGGIVGYDREKKLKSAGLKTNILICVGACLYTSMGLLNLNTPGTVSDPNRLAAQIVSGVGFLGAGAIIHGRGNVTGLTTAATIWVVAAIGYTVGIGRLFSAALFSLTVLLILKLINPIYRLVEKSAGQKTFQLDVLSKGPIKRILKDIILAEGLETPPFSEEVIDEKQNAIVTTVILSAGPHMMERICHEIETMVTVKKVSYHIHQEENGEINPSTPSS
ncbi:MAG: MgtC/SapB family protein [Bacteriovoracales bacterium]|nr:MgtC/SapB family protein [Bacteriovoracales bacterium]